MNQSSECWRRCSICKKPINYRATYQKCNVSTCRKHAYCSVDCWSVHVPVMGHKSAWAEEETAPAYDPNQSSADSSEGAPLRRIIVGNKPANQNDQSDENGEYSMHDILIVASKLKGYVKGKYEMNTSANVMEELSIQVRRLVDDAVMRARQEGRKTLMDRDFHA